MTDMTIAFSGELKWSGVASAPLIIDSLMKVPGGKRIVINFHWPGDGSNDAYNAHENATTWDKKQRPLLRSWPNIALDDPSESAYLIQQFMPYRNRDQVPVMLLWILKELSDGEGQQYCYVVGHWTQGGTDYECSGLLKGYPVDWLGSAKG